MLRRLAWMAVVGALVASAWFAGTVFSSTRNAAAPATTTPSLASTTTEPPPTTSTTTTTTSPPTTTSTTVPVVGWSSPTTLPPWSPSITCFADPPSPYGPKPYEFDSEFYTHWCSASGIPVIGSDAVPLTALEAAAQLVNRVIGYDPVNTAETIANGGLVILYDPVETAAALPEWEYVEGRTGHVSEDHPGFTASGGGITFAVVVWDDPVCAVPESRQDAYGTADWGSVLVHELGHLAAGPSTQDRLTDFITGNVTTAYQAALEGSAWHDLHYAMSNPAEYWAEATQVYFGQYSSKARGLRQPRTRAELAEQDPLIHSLLQTVYGDRTGLGRYWCEVYDGPVTLLPDDEADAGYAPVP